MSMANPVSLWAFLAGVTVERGEPRGHPAFQTCAQGAIPIMQPAYTAKQLRLLMRGGASGRSPTPPPPWLLPPGPQIFIFPGSLAPPAPGSLGPAWPTLLTERPGSFWCRVEADVDQPGLGSSAAGEGGLFACSPRCSQVLPCITYQLKLQ